MGRSLPYSLTAQQRKHCILIENKRILPAATAYQRIPHLMIKFFMHGKKDNKHYKKKLNQQTTNPITLAVFYLGAHKTNPQTGLICAETVALAQRPSSLPCGMSALSAAFHSPRKNVRQHFRNNRTAGSARPAAKTAGDKRLHSERLGSLFPGCAVNHL